MTTYPAKWQAMADLTVAYIVKALRQLGVFGRAGERQTAASIISQTGILPTYAGLLGRWLDHLAAQGDLVPDGDGFVSEVGPGGTAVPHPSSPPRKLPWPTCRRCWPICSAAATGCRTF
jgi:hypothetical protein